jgi:hypothetical protein
VDSINGLGLFVNTNNVDGNIICFSLLRSPAALNGVTDINLKRSKNNEDVGICLVEGSRNKKPKLPKKRLNKLLKKKGRP